MPYLAFNLNDGNEFVFDLLEDRLSIGREAKNDIVIDNTFISGQHAEIVRLEDGSYEVVDLKSSNGTFVNGKRVFRGRVKVGDKISFGQLDARFRDRPPTDAAPVQAAKSPSTAIAGPLRPEGRRRDTELVRVQGPLVITPFSASPAKESAKVSGLGAGLSKGNSAATPTTGAYEVVHDEPMPAGQETEKLTHGREHQDASAADAEASRKKEMDETEARLVAIRGGTEALSKATTDHEVAMAGVVAAKREFAVLQESIESARKNLATAQRLAATEEQKAEALSGKNEKLSAATRALAELELKREALDAAVVALADKRMSAEKEVAEISLRRDALNREVSETEAKARALASDIERRELKALELSVVEKKLGDIAGSLTDAESRKAELDSTLASLQVQQKTRQNELSEVEKRIDTLNEKNQTAEAHLASVQHEAVQVEKRLAAAQAEAKVAESKLEDAKGEFTRHELRLAEQELVSRQKNTTEIEERVTELNRNAEAAEQRVRIAEEQSRKLTQVSEQLTGSQKALEETQQKFAAQSAQLEELRRNTAEAENAFKTRTAEAERAFAAKIAELEGVEKRIEALNGREIELAARVEQLTTLGASVSGERDAKAAELERIAEQGAAQHALLRTVARLHADTSEELRQTEAKYRETAKQLSAALASLGETEAAIRSKQQLVLEGEERLQKVGTEAAGKLELVKKARQQLADITAEISSAEQQRDKTGEEIKSLSAQLSKTRGELDIESTKSAEKLQSLTEAETRFGEMEARLAATQAKLTEAEKDLESQQQAVKQTGERVQALATEEQRLAQSKTQADEELKSLTEKLSRARAELEEAARLASERQEAARDAEALLARHEAGWKGVQGKASALEAVVVNLAAAESQHKERIESSMAELTRKQGEAAAVESNLATARAALQKAEEDRENVEKIIKSLAQEKQVKSEELGQLAELGAAQQALVKTLENRCVAADDAMKQIEAKRIGAAKTLEETLAQTDSARMSISLAEGRTKSLSVESAQLEKARSELKAEFESVQAQTSKAKGELELLQSQATKARNELDKVGEVAARNQQAATEAQALVATLTGEAQRLQPLADSLAKQKRELETAVGTMKVEADRLRATTANLRKASDEAGAALKKTESDQEAATKQFEALRAESGKLESKIEESRKTIDSESAGKLELVKKAGQQLDDLTTKMSDLEQQRAQKEEELNALSAQLSQARKDLDLAAKQSEEKRQSVVEAATRSNEAEAHVAATLAKLSDAEKMLKTQQQLVQQTGERVEALVDEEQKLIHSKTQAGEELRSLTEQLSRTRVELEEAARVMAERQRAAGEAEALFARHEMSWKGVQGKAAALEAVVLKLSATESQHKERITVAASELERKQSEAAVVESNLAAARTALEKAEEDRSKVEATIKSLAHEQHSKAEELKKLAEQGTAQHTLVRTLQKLAVETQHLQPLAESLRTQKAELESALDTMKGEAERLRAETSTLQDGRDAVAAIFKKTQSDHDAATRQLEALRAEAGKLEASIADRRRSLDAEAVDKLELVKNTEACLADLTAKVSEGEQRLAQLGDLEGKIASAHTGLKSAESQMVAAEKALAEIVKSKMKISEEVTALQQKAAEEKAKSDELTRRTKDEESRFGDLEKRTANATTVLQQLETKLAAAEQALEGARTEEKLLKGSIPALNKDMATLTTAVAALVAQRDGAAQFVTRMNVDTDASKKHLAELQANIATLEDAQRIRTDLVKKTQEEVDATNSKLSTAKQNRAAAEAVLVELKKQAEDYLQMVEVARRQAGGVDDEMRIRLDRVQSLKSDEERLVKTIESQREKLRAMDEDYQAAQGKIKAVEAQFAEVTQTGGRLMSITEALKLAETRQQETLRSLNGAAEEELALQVKLGGLHDAVGREATHLEHIKGERQRAEQEFRKYAEDLQRQADALEKADQDRRRQIVALEKQVEELAATEKRGAETIEVLRTNLVGMEHRKAEIAQAETKMQQWQDVEKRLLGQLAELEEKHEVLRKGLATDEATVLIFANDLIKRIDLIDVLIQRYTGANGGGIEQQLRTLRASFEDILHQHGVTEFEVAPGTEVDVAMRHRITILDSAPGKSKPKVIESYRPGFMYSPPDGREVILRKVEVKTSSQ